MPAAARLHHAAPTHASRRTRGFTAARDVIARRLHDRNLERGDGRVALPGALAGKLPAAAHEWAWQWVFPASSHYVDTETGERRRHHLHESAVQRAVRAAVVRARIPKRATWWRCS